MITSTLKNPGASLRSHLCSFCRSLLYIIVIFLGISTLSSYLAIGNSFSFGRNRSLLHYLKVNSLESILMFLKVLLIVPHAQQNALLIHHIPFIWLSKCLSLSSHLKFLELMIILLFIIYNVADLSTPFNLQSTFYFIFILQQSNGCWWSVPDWNLYRTAHWLWWRGHFWL